MRQVKIAAFLVYFLQKKQKILAICDGLDLITMYYAKGQVSFADMILI